MCISGQLIRNKMGDTDKMFVYEGYNKARDCRVDTLVKHEVHRYLSTSEWINAACMKERALLNGTSRRLSGSFLNLFFSIYATHSRRKTDARRKDYEQR